MNKLVTAATLVASIVVPSFANAEDWTGPYVGVSFSSNSGPVDFLFNGSFSHAYDYAGEQIGVFGGYNFGVGGYIVGIEASYSEGDVHNVNPIYSAYRVNPIIDVKARAGKDIGGAFLYATGGVSTGTYFESTFEEVPLSGTVYGAGIETMVSDRIVLGLEALQHELSGDYPISTAWSVEPSFTTMQVRAAYKF